MLLWRVCHCCWYYSSIIVVTFILIYFTNLDRYPFFFLVFGVAVRILIWMHVMFVTVLLNRGLKYIHVNPMFRLSQMHLTVVWGMHLCIMKAVQWVGRTYLSLSWKIIFDYTCWILYIFPIFSLENTFENKSYLIPHLEFYISFKFWAWRTYVRMTWENILDSICCAFIYLVDGSPKCLTKCASIKDKLKVYHIPRWSVHLPHTWC